MNKYTHLVKLARFCVTLAISVSVRAVRSSGYSCMRLKSEGDMMAGHRKRRKRDALISRSLMSGRPRLLHSCLQDANTSLSSRGNTLEWKHNKMNWPENIRANTTFLLQLKISVYRSWTTWGWVNDDFKPVSWNLV